MQKFFALLLTVTALLSLSACGSNSDNAARQYPPSVYDGTGGNNGTGGNGSPAPRNNPSGDPLTPSEQLWDHDEKNGDDNDMDIPVTPYDDMVENGRVRDTDGILSDGENPQK